MVVGSSPRFTLYLLAVSSLLVFATSFRRWGASRNKVSSYSPSLLPIGSCSSSSFNQLKQPSPLPHSLNNDEGGRFDGGDGNGTILTSYNYPNYIFRKPSVIIYTTFGQCTLICCVISIYLFVSSRWWRFPHFRRRRYQSLLR